MSSLLHLRGITRRFAGLTAVDAVSMTVAPGEIRGLIGPNGAGKTTLLNVISGLIRPTDGVIELNATDITAVSAERRAAMGVRRTFQNLKLFETLTVLENVLIGLHADGKSGVLGAVFRARSTVREDVALHGQASAALDIVGLSMLAGVQAASLPYGYKRLLEIARAIVAKPKLLLLDEPAAGLNPTEASNLVHLLRRLNASGITILLVEHHMDVIMAACSRITVLNYGKMLTEGSPVEIQENPQVIEAYLGRPGLEERLAAYA